MTTYQVTFNPRESSQLVIIGPDQKVEDLIISNSKQQSYQNATLKLTDIDKDLYSSITIGSEIEIEIDETLEFEGFVSRKNKMFAGAMILDIQCTGRTFDLERYTTAASVTYTGDKTGLIARTLLETYTSVGDFDYTNISSTDGVTIQTITFESESLNACFQRLTEFDGFNYYVGSKRR